MNPSIYSLISLKGSNLYIGPHIVSLHGRKKTKRLLEAMLKGDERETGLHREQLKSEVYGGERSSSAMSLRLRESQDGSLSKLISRSRSFLRESLRDTSWAQEVDWFVYSQAERRWQLAVRNRA